jgi:hypothetical protein
MRVPEAIEEYAIAKKHGDPRRMKEAFYAYWVQTRGRKDIEKQAKRRGFFKRPTPLERLRGLA